MSQTNINTNNGQYRNQNSGRGGRGQEGRGNFCNDCRNKLIAKYTFGKMKDGPISKLLITETGYRPTQNKKIIDTFPVLFADKNFQGLNGVIRTENNLVERDFMPTYANVTQWSTIHYVQVSIVNQNDSPYAITGEHPL